MTTAPGGLLPSPYIVCQPFETTTLVQVNFGVTAWPANNRALYTPLRLPTTQMLVSVSIWCTTTGSGTFDLGIYDSLGTTRLQSQGSTSLVAASLNTWTLTSPLMIEGGRRYFLAMSCSTTTATIGRQAASALYQNKMAGMAQEASAHPLPNPATPSGLLSVYAPIYSLGFRT